MGGILRKIDDASEINEWVTTMATINCLLKDLELKPCSDNWRPWSEIKNDVKKNLEK